MEGEHLEARPEEDELMNSIPEGVEEVWTTFSRCLSIPKLQMVILIQVMDVDPGKCPWKDRSMI